MYVRVVYIQDAESVPLALDTTPDVRWPTSCHMEENSSVGRTTIWRRTTMKKKRKIGRSRTFGFGRIWGGENATYVVQCVRVGAYGTPRHGYSWNGERGEGWRLRLLNMWEIWVVVVAVVCQANLRGGGGWMEAWMDGWIDGCSFRRTDRRMMGGLERIHWECAGGGGWTRTPQTVGKKSAMFHSTSQTPILDVWTTLMGWTNREVPTKTFWLNHILFEQNQGANQGCLCICTIHRVGISKLLEESNIAWIGREIFICTRSC